MSEEEQLFLEELVANEDYWRVIVKLLEMGVEKQNEKVLSSDLSEGDRAVVLSKARAEGARALSLFVQSAKRKKEKRDGRR